MNIYIPVLGFSRSGGARVLAELASAWVGSGHRVAFLANQYSHPPYFPTKGDVYWLDDDGRRVERGAPRNELRSGPLSVYRGLRSLRRGLNRYARPGDVILANQSLTAWPAALNSSGARAYYYVQAYEPEVYWSRGDLRSKLLYLASWGSYFLPLKRIVNAEMYLNYRALRAEHVVAPGVDFALFHSEPTRRRDEDLKGRAVRLGCVGRKEPDKGTIYVIAAFEELLKRGRDVELLVAYGNIPPEIAAHPRCRVVVPGNDRELAEFYRSVDILIAPGVGQLRSPHYPVMEAMACGVPVVSTGSIPSADDNCWLVPERDGRAIADAVEDIVARPQERSRRVEKALQDIRPFAWPKIAVEMMGLLEQS